VQTYILIQAVPGVDLRALARQVDRLPGVERVQVVTGPYDLIAEGRSEDPRALRLAISKLDGVPADGRRAGRRRMGSRASGNLGQDPAKVQVRSSTRRVDIPAARLEAPPLAISLSRGVSSPHDTLVSRCG
jgi:Lrp/AsnC ligand binding domain